MSFVVGHWLFRGCGVSQCVELLRPEVCKYIYIYNISIFVNYIYIIDRLDNIYIYNIYIVLPLYP